MRSAIVIPARLQSTRLERKLLLARTGMPLVCHAALVAATACRAAPELFAGVIVATDAEEIRHAVESFVRERGLPVTTSMTSPDHPSGTDRVAEAAGDLPGQVASIVNLQADEPEMDPTEIVRLARHLHALGTPPAVDIATLAWPLTGKDAWLDANRVKVVLDARGFALYFSRAPIPHRRDPAPEPPPPALWHLGIYAYWRESLQRFVGLPPGRLETTEKLEQLRALEHGMRIAVLPAASKPAKGIDTESDYRAFVRRWRRARR